MSVEHLELKKLQTMLSQAQVDLRDLQEKHRESEKRLNDARLKVRDVEGRIEKLKRFSEKVIVSEHAILRYVERVMGIDLDEIKRKIAPDSLEELTQKLPSGRFPVNGFAVRVKDRVVTTIITKDDDDEPKRANRNQHKHSHAHAGSNQEDV
jgi:hypothetical protein